MSYHNTNGLSGSELKKATVKNLKQDIKVLEFFKKHPDKELSSCDVYRRLRWNNSPLTSLRRSINTLANNNLLKDTGKRKVGIYGSPVRLWKLNSKKK